MDKQLQRKKQKIALADLVLESANLPSFSDFAKAVADLMTEPNNEGLRRNVNAFLDQFPIEGV